MTFRKIAQWYRLAHQRFREDFRLSLITMFCLPTATAIAGFTVYRFINGNMLMGVLDTVLVLVFLAILVFSWTTGRVVVAGIILVVITGAGVLGVVYLVGLLGLFWAFVDILITFFLSPPTFALPKVVALAVGTLVLGAQSGLNAVQLVSYGTTFFLVSLFAYSFSALSRAQASQLEELATRDPLTGAGNRRMLEEELAITIAANERDSANTGLLMLDLDYFKQVNDRYGHAEGDEVLRQFASLVENHSRRGDRFFRFGGEEFVLLLNVNDLKGMENAARHIHQVIRDYLTCAGGEVTCSIGGSLIRSGDNWESWLHRADQALYKAKQSGRDAIVLAENQQA